MKNAIQRMLMPSAMALMLGFLSFSAQAQCDPQVQLKDGSRGTSATYCENEPIPFFENSTGYNTTTNWEIYAKGTTSPLITSSTLPNPTFSIDEAGDYDVVFAGTGPAGNCNRTLSLKIEPSPDIIFHLLSPDSQCFEGNTFCFVDSSKTVITSSIVRQTYLFSDGDRIDTLNPVFPINFCKSFADNSGGWFDLVIESEDQNGCVTKITYRDYLFITPKMGIEFNNITPQPNPGCDSTLGRFRNVSLVDLKDITSFCWDFGDGNIICGDSITNTEWWEGPDPSKPGVIEHMYRQNGTFDGSLTVTSKFGCTETYTWKAAVTNLILEPVILSDKDSSCASDNPVAFWLKDGPPAGASQWLWNFGDPPSGPLNFNDEDWEVDHNYGVGPWMISLRIVAGPCDVTVYDTITKIGPSSTIEVPFNRVPEEETYQCLITDSIHFPNNSSFRHNDPWANNDDSVVFFYTAGFRVWKNPATGIDSLQYIEYDNDGKVARTVNYALSGTINERGYSVTYNAGKDSLQVVYGGNTTYEDKNFFGHNRKARYVFNYNAVTMAGDQTAIPNADQVRGMNPHVWRVWDFGDQYAPQCTTDSRPWVNKNIGINCNWTIDTLPVHWYTPWDEIYTKLNNGNFYRTPAKRTLFNKAQRRCYEVDVYPSDTVIIPGDTVITIPYGEFTTYQGVTIGVLDGFPAPQYKLGNWIVRRPPPAYVAPYIYRDDSVFVIEQPGGTTVYEQAWRVGRDSVTGCFTYTVVGYDMDVRIPAGVTVDILKLPAQGGGGAGVGTTRTEVGPKTITLEADEQFTICEGDSLYPIFTIEENDADTIPATISKFMLDDGTLVDSIFVDSAYHREDFFLENGRCYQAVLWQKDTVHPLQCESTNNKSLALIPPSARGLEIVSGIPCPLDGDNLSYYLVFDLGETKPGCSQQWFAVNFDSLADPTNFIASNSGGINAPPPPGLPIPFVFPYQITGNRPVQFTKGYTPGEIGNDPSLRQPNGSFTVGLIVGNGQPDPNGNPPECLDTTWYHDMFRILYLNADFTILHPTQEIKAICAGDSAFFMLAETRQDSIKSLRWNWGYQGIGRGVNFSAYIEIYEYYQPYTGPVPGRNDEDIVWNGEDWLYNYVIRQNINDVTGLEILDTIVTSIMYEWEIVADKSGSDEEIFDLFEAKGLYLPDIPAEDVALYLGPSDPPYCIDTTGLSQLFKFGIKPYSEKVDPLVKLEGNKRYLYDDTTFTTKRLVGEVLHFRDSSIKGFDSLYIDTNFDGKKEWVHGLYRFDYRHPKIVKDPCDGSYDTIMVPSNGPMIPNFFLNNTVGCEKRGAALLNVGFLNDFWLDNPNICNGLQIQLDDTLRYWQYGDFMFPDDYPIDPRDFWHDANRYLNNIEYSKVDWDASDGLGPVFDRGLTPTYTYTEPGTYEITVIAKDSINCYDTVRLTAFVTEVIPGFSADNVNTNCNTIVNFTDTSIVNDPCLISPDCTEPSPCDSIISWEWDFGDSTRKSLLQNPSHDYTRGGWFTVTLTVKTVLGCEETISQQIYIPGPRPEFEFELNEWNLRDSAVICVGDSISLMNKSGGDKVDPTWEMRWGDGDISNPGDSGSFYGHIYDTPGTYELFLIQFDEVNGRPGCSRIFPDTNPDLVTQRRIKVVVLPIAEADLEIVDPILCVDDSTEFIAHVDTSVYDRYQWLMGDGNEYNRNEFDSVIRHAYAAPGSYDVTLIPLYTNPDPFLPVCSDSAFATVQVVDVVADFDIDSSDMPRFLFTNTTDPINSSYQWTFQDVPTDGTSTEVNPEYIWDDRIGEWEVCLIATHPTEGCMDTICKTITNTFQRKLILYNIFTPPSAESGGDGMNDVFLVEGKGLEMYNIKIFNRWGEKVFESDNVDEPWDGTINNNGTIECPDGTYFYVINYQFEFDEENEGLGPIEGTVDLIRQK